LVKRIGIIGVAWGTAVPSLVTSLLFWPWYIRRTLHIQPHTYALSAWIRPSSALIPFVLGTYCIERFWPTTNLALFFFQVALMLPLAAIGYWFICFDQSQREEYLGKLTKSV
jgi:hypothetical protein